MLTARLELILMLRQPGGTNMPKFDVKYAVALVGAALAMLVLFLILTRQPQPLDTQAAVQVQARQDVQKMIDEDMAAAKAQAELNAMIRQAEMDAADNVLNSMAVDANLAEPLMVDELPSATAAAESQEPAEPAQSNVLSRGIYLRGGTKQDPAGKD
jgi:hypothetical protein